MNALAESLMTSNSRLETLTWVLEMAHHQQFSVHSAQLACAYFDLFSLKWGNSDAEVVRVVAATCLMLASKFLEVEVLTPDWVSEVCGRKASAEDIQSLELVILNQLDYDLDQPTAAEAIRLVLGLTAPGHDFSQLIAESDAYASACYPSLKLAIYGPVTIGVAAVCCALEQRNLFEFRDQWLSLVLEKTAVKQETVAELSSKIKTQLKDMYGSDAETECGSPGLERTLSV